MLSCAALLAITACAQAQSFHIVTHAQASLGPFPSETDTCLLFDADPNCMAEAKIEYVEGTLLAESYGLAQYEELGYGSQLRSASRAWSIFGPPGDPEPIGASSGISAIITWESGSDTLDPGTPIRIRFLFPYAGTLSMGIPVGGAFTSVSSKLTLIDDTGGSVLLDAAASFTGINDFVTFFDDSGHWEGDFVRQGVEIPGWGDADGWALETVDEAEYDSILGERIVVFFGLNTFAYTPDENDHAVMADFSNTGAYSMEAVDPKTGEPLDVEFVPIACYADCDYSTGIHELDILDFVCFQQRFVDGHPYADCNGDGSLDILDFVCFQQAFLEGCED